MLRCAAVRGHGVCSQTSLPCYGCKMAAGRDKRGMALVKMLRNLTIKEIGDFSCTHQSKEHLKKHSAEAPPVHCWAVWVALQHLWSEVLWSPAECMHSPAYGHPFLAKPKVSQHYMPFTVQQDVLRFEVSERDRRVSGVTSVLQKYIKWFCWCIFIQFSLVSPWLLLQMIFLI